MSVGLAFMRRLLSGDQQVSFLADHSIDENLFEDDEKDAFEFIKTHINHYGQFPTVETVQVETGVEIREFPDEPIGY